MLLLFFFQSPGQGQVPQRSFALKLGHIGFYMPSDLFRRYFDFLPTRTKWAASFHQHLAGRVAQAVKYQNSVVSLKSIAVERQRQFS